jgi:hypothetical protein
VRAADSQARRHGGRFFGRRVNCEQVPFLPAWAVAQVLDDPRESSYVLVWKRASSAFEESARLSPDEVTGAVKIEREDGSVDVIRTLLRSLPRNGGSSRFLICHRCEIPRRGLYGWAPGGPFNTSVQRSPWGCRACNKLRYSSEGGALVERGRGTIARMFEDSFGRSRSARPEPWHPCVFTSPEGEERAD